MSLQCEFRTVRAPVTNLEIYEMPHSPYCIPILHALECFEVAFQRREIPNWDRREIARLTGGRYYQVPVVADGENIVFETEADPLAVPRYLDKKFFGGVLLPPEWSGVQEILVDHIEGELESYSFKLCDIHYLNTIEDLGERSMMVRHKERSFGRGCIEQWRANAPHLKEHFEELLEAFDRRLQHAPYLLGSAPLYADFALLGVVGNYTYQEFNTLPQRLDALCSWHRRLTTARL